MTFEFSFVVGSEKSQKKKNNAKLSRLKGASVYIEMGHVLLPKKEEPWWKDFKKELFGFPGTKYKDQVDAFTQAITYFQKQVQ